jgi:hypothetical protein
VLATWINIKKKCLVLTFDTHDIACGVAAFTGWNYPIGNYKDGYFPITSLPTSQISPTIAVSNFRRRGAAGGVQSE